MPKKFARAQLQYDADAHSLACAVDLGDEPSLTIQSAKDEADINVIVKRFGVTGHVNVPSRMPTFEDYEEVVDFHTAMNAVNEARVAFMSLPAETRAVFRNDPQLFLEVAQNPDNEQMFRDLGLANPKNESSITPAPDEPARSSDNERGSDTVQSAASGAASSGKSGSKA